MVTRLTEQKGIDLLSEALPEMLQSRDFGLMVLGSGDPKYAAFFDQLARRFPQRVAFRAGYNESLAHMVEAGSDIFLMPSRYEPCGLNQMYSLRYGTIPIVRNTGGLADSVQHFNPDSGVGTGCVFNDYDVPAVRWAIRTTLEWYADSEIWRNADAKRNGAGFLLGPADPAVRCALPRFARDRSRLTSLLRLRGASPAGPSTV